MLSFQPHAQPFKSVAPRTPARRRHARMRNLDVIPATGPVQATGDAEHASRSEVPLRSRSPHQP